MNILITHGSLTGNAELCSNHIYQHLRTNENYNLEIEPLQDLIPSELNNYELVILGIATYNHGKYHDICSDFFEELEKLEAKLNSSFIIFGLGDRSYEIFATAGEIASSLIKAKGGKVIKDNHKIDGYPTEEVLGDLLSDIFEGIKEYRKTN